MNSSKYNPKEEMAKLLIKNKVNIKLLIEFFEKTFRDFDDYGKPEKEAALDQAKGLVRLLKEIQQEYPLLSDFTEETSLLKMEAMLDNVQKFRKLLPPV